MSIVIIRVIHNNLYFSLIYM